MRPTIKKIEEVKAALGPEFTIVSLSEIGCNEELPETGDTLEYNAFQKARHVFDNYGVDCFADDTGLEVEALDGAPGVYSGRFAGEPRSDERNIDLLLSKMSGKENRKARFKTVIALIQGSQEKALPEPQRVKYYRKEQEMEDLGMILFSSPMALQRHLQN